MSDRGRYRKVHSNEWHAAAFQSLSDAEKVVYFYAKTGPQSTSVGIYRISTALAVEDIGNLTAVEFDLRLDTVCQACGWVFDPTTRVLWMLDWLQDNPPQPPNVCKSWRKLLDNLPDCDLKFAAIEAVFQHLKELPNAFRENFGKLPKDLRISQPQPVAKPESHQGSGIRDQGSGEQRTGGAARRTPKSAQNGTSPHEPTKLDRVVREASRHFHRQDDVELKLDTVRELLHTQGLNRDAVTRQDMLAALARAEALV